MINLRYLTVLIKCYIFKDCAEYIIKKYETLPTNPPTKIYISKVNKTLLLKIKDGCKRELKTLKSYRITNEVVW